MREGNYKSLRIVDETGVERMSCVCSTERSVKSMSTPDHCILRNRGIRSRVMIMCQLMENSSTEGLVRIAKFLGDSKTSAITQQKDPLWQEYTS